MNNWKIAVTIVALFIAGAITTPAAFADQIDLGKHSQDEIRKTCNANGGHLLGISDSGLYGCENDDQGTLIICDKNQKCTGWTAAQTRAQGKKILANAGLKGEAVKSASGKPKAPASGGTK